MSEEQLFLFCLSYIKNRETNSIILRNHLFHALKVSLLEHETACVGYRNSTSVAAFYIREKFSFAV